MLSDAELDRYARQIILPAFGGAGQAKLARKGCDWIVANDVAADPMGGENNRVHIVSKDGVDSWDRLPKGAVALKLMEKIADELDTSAPLESD